MGSLNEVLPYLADYFSQYTSHHGNEALGKVFESFSYGLTSAQNFYETNPVEAAVATVIGLGGVALLSEGVGAVEAVDAIAGFIESRGTAVLSEETVATLARPTAEFLVNAGIAKGGEKLTESLYEISSEFVDHFGGSINHSGYDNPLSNDASPATDQQFSITLPPLEPEAISSTDSSISSYLVDASQTNSFNDLTQYSPQTLLPDFYSVENANSSVISTSLFSDQYQNTEYTGSNEIPQDNSTIYSSQIPESFYNDNSSTDLYQGSSYSNPDITTYTPNESASFSNPYSENILPESSYETSTQDSGHSFNEPITSESYMPSFEIDAPVSHDISTEISSTSWADSIADSHPSADASY